MFLIFFFFLLIPFTGGVPSGEKYWRSSCSCVPAERDRMLMAAASVMAPPNPLIFWYFWSGTTVNLRPERETRDAAVHLLQRHGAPPRLHPHLRRCRWPGPGPGPPPACCRPCCSGRRSTGPMEAERRTPRCHSRLSCTHTPQSRGPGFWRHIDWSLEGGKEVTAS